MPLATEGASDVQGDFVLVAGEIMDAGQQLATVIVALPESLTAEDAQVYLRAKIESVSNTGYAASGNSVINLTNSTSADISSDNTIEVFGVIAGTEVLASSASALN